MLCCCSCLQLMTVCCMICACAEEYDKASSKFSDASKMDEGNQEALHGRIKCKILQGLFDQVRSRSEGGVLRRQQETSSLRVISRRNRSSSSCRQCRTSVVRSLSFSVQRFGTAQSPCAAQARARSCSSCPRCSAGASTATRSSRCARRMCALLGAVPHVLARAQLRQLNDAVEQHLAAVENAAPGAPAQSRPPALR